MTGGGHEPATGQNKRKPLLIAVGGLAAVAALAAFVVLATDWIPRPENPARAGCRRGGDGPAAGRSAARRAPDHPSLRETISATCWPQHGFSPTEVNTLCEQTRPVYDLRRIHAGRELRLYAAADGRIERLEYDVTEIDYLAVDRRDGRFEAVLEHRPVDIRVKEIWGSIEDSLILAFNKLGEEDPLALAFAELFGWDVDFYMDLQPGDSFKVIFEKRYIEGEFAGDGNILAAELINEGKVYRAFHYEPPDTKKPGYYNEAGASMEKEFRRSPIKWARVSSRFSGRRLHPIRRVYAPHYGVDYAAPLGTPIQATADGVVVSAGWNGGAGRMVRIRHKNNYETMYLHLQSFAQGIRARARVKGGDVIGYVGSSGDSTGPHVDYRILRGGGYLNPLSAKFAPVEPLKPEFVEEYKKSVGRFRLLLDDPLLFFRGILI